MKKFLAVFDGYQLSESTLAYAQELTAKAGAHLVGVFLDDFVYHTYSAREVYEKYQEAENVIEQFNEEEQKRRDETVRQFEESCRKAAIPFSVLRKQSLAILELEHQSMFADLIIISEQETFSRYKQPSPTPFMKDLLADVQCPVLVVPARYQPIDKIVLLYDGRPSSMYAIRMFSYLLDKLQTLPVEVFRVEDESKNGFQLPDMPLMQEFVQRHFPQAEFISEKGNAEELILRHLKEHKENEMVVMGAYRRNEFSRWFKESMADVLMRELDTPLFIAHNK